MEAKPAAKRKAKKNTKKPAAQAPALIEEKREDLEKNSALSESVQKSRTYKNEEEWWFFLTNTRRGMHLIFTYPDKEGHPWANFNEGKSCIAVNGIRGRVLYIRKEWSYHLTSRTRKVVITEHPYNGKEKVLYEIPPNTTLTINVPVHLPEILYYQDAEYDWCGGIIVLGKPIHECTNSQCSECSNETIMP